jgi:hypothetical protein
VKDEFEDPEMKAEAEIVQELAKARRTKGGPWVQKVRWAPKAISHIPSKWTLNAFVCVILTRIDESKVSQAGSCARQPGCGGQR